MIIRRILLGAWLGFLVLGVGGRIVMRWIALATGTPASFNFGGTLTVVASGIAAGIAGALLYTVSDAIARRVPRRDGLVRAALFVLLLGLVTARGLRGSPPDQSVGFWPLVALYAGAFVWLAPRRHAGSPDASDSSRSRRRWPLRFNRAPGNVR